MAGGIFFPLAKALCLACGSDPAKGTEKKMGAYVMKTCFQTSCISSAMFITAMAANPLAVNLASEALGQPISWGAWALAGIVPGLICLAAAPLILYVLYPPGKPVSRGWLQASATAYSIQGCLRVHAVGNLVMMLCCCTYAYQSIHDVNQLALGSLLLMPSLMTIDRLTGLFMDT